MLKSIVMYQIYNSIKNTVDRSYYESLTLNRDSYNENLMNELKNKFDSSGYVTQIIIEQKCIVICVALQRQ